jgi:transcriptional regulator with XRE-family HTH domain
MRAKVVNARVRRRVGRKIKRLRNLREWSQEQLAERAGHSTKHIGEVERGAINVTLDVLISIAVSLSVDLAELVRGVFTGGASPAFFIAEQDRAWLEKSFEQGLDIVTRVKRTRPRRPRVRRPRAN